MSLWPKSWPGSVVSLSEAQRVLCRCHFGMISFVAFLFVSWRFGLQDLRLSWLMVAGTRVCHFFTVLIFVGFCHLFQCFVICFRVWSFVFSVLGIWQVQLASFLVVFLLRRKSPESDRKLEKSIDVHWILCCGSGTVITMLAKLHYQLCIQDTALKRPTQVACWVMGAC